MIKKSTAILITPALTFLTVMIITPLFFMIRVSLLKPPEEAGFYIPDTFTFQNYGLIFDNYGISIILKTSIFALEISFITIFISLGFALLIQKSSKLLRVISITCLLLPKLTSPLLIIFGLQRILGDHGIINELLLFLHICNHPATLIRNHLGALIGETYLILPFSSLLIFIQLNSINEEIKTAAKGLGASNYQVFKKITLPLCYPGLFTVWQLSMAWGMSCLLGPLFLGSPSESTIACEIYHQTFELGNWPLAAAWSVFLTTTTIVFLLTPKLFTSFFTVHK